MDGGVSGNSTRGAAPVGARTLELNGDFCMMQRRAEEPRRGFALQLGGTTTATGRAFAVEIVFKEDGDCSASVLRAEPLERKGAARSRPSLSQTLRSLQLRLPSRSRRRGPSRV